MYDISCFFDINEVYPNQSTMKVIIVALAIAALAAAAPTEYKEPPKILHSEFNQKPDGGYSFSFESEDGTSRQEEGTLKELPDEENKLHPVIIVRGLYTYLNSEGKEETITYEGDQNGYRASGDSIPKQASRR